MHVNSKRNRLYQKIHDELKRHNMTIARIQLDLVNYVSNVLANFFISFFADAFVVAFLISGRALLQYDALSYVWQIKNNLFEYQVVQLLIFQEKLDNVVVTVYSG